MMSASEITMDRIECPPGADPEFASEVVAGLSASPKTLPTRFLYDARGSELFEQITELEEYYPTRTEIDILHEAAPEWASTLPRDTTLVEFGSGSSIKTEILLAASGNITAYVPIDVSKAALDEACQRLQARFHELDIVPLEADFTSAVLPERLGGRSRAGFFPGSTIGNFEQDVAIALLKRFAEIVGPDGRLLIGVDLRKERGALERAYDDSEGVTAEFNLNLLARMQRELGAVVDLKGYEHLALYNEEKGRVEMHLVSRSRQTIEVCGHRFELAPGERIHTENSHKHTIESFQGLARCAGWRAENVWADPNRMFSVHALRADLRLEECQEE
jgi:dimethylhistidine N-methyltransferase